MATAPRSAALKPESEPSSLPMGVRAPATMTEFEGMSGASRLHGDDLCHDTHDERERLWEARPMLTRIDHIGIACHDLDATIAFYRDTYGFTDVHVEINE